MRDNKPMVSSLSLSFKRAVAEVTEDREEAKREHRGNLKTLAEKYMQDVQEGKAEGIRNAKEFVEVIKADLLLMGEATERQDNLNPVDEIKVTKVAQAIDLNADTVQALMNDVMMALNNANDDADHNIRK